MIQIAFTKDMVQSVVFQFGKCTCGTEHCGVRFYSDNPDSFMAHLDLDTRHFADMSPALLDRAELMVGEDHTAIVEWLKKQPDIHLEVNENGYHHFT